MSTSREETAREDISNTELEPIPPVQGDAFDTNGPRLMITHIVNEDFKSYAGIQSLGPFHKSFSSIVGPNGSGKSNVIDSMLFVFGYRASKIRSKKLSVLIHNSEKYKNVNSCTVSVYFQKIIDTGPGDDDYDVVPGSKFVVSRTAFKDNTSYYRLNEKKATYKEVAIGEVEQIAMMKPKAPNEHEDGMLEFLEDIIGCSRFKEPIERVASRVEELNEMRGEKLNRVKVVEKEKNDLESVKNEAVEYLTLDNNITKKKNVMYQKYIHDCSVFEKKAAEKRDEILEKKKEHDEKLFTILEEKKDKNKEHNKLDELRMIPEKSEKDVADLEKKLKKLDAEKAVEEEKLKEVMESLKTETQYSVAQSELDIYISNQKTEITRLKDIQQNLEKTETTLQDRKKAVGDLQKKLPELKNGILKAQKDLEVAAEHELKIVDEVREMRVKVEDVRSSLQQSQSRGSVLEALMELKKSGGLTGIYGRLGDLGAIDTKYDVAISTACGALDHIVVDSINTAQACVEFLKKNNVGSATFIGLEKMNKWKGHCKRTITTPENVPRLFDLVKVSDEMIRPAFYFALRDTLVAKDLDQATRIAYGKTRYRVVTLGGQLIDQSGTMSGGGSRVSKGRMGSKVVSDVDPEQMQNMEHHLEKSLTEQEVSLKQQKREQETRVKDAAPDEKQLKRLEKSVAAFKKEYEKAQSEANKVEEEVHRLHRQIMDIGGTKLKAAESRINLVQTQIDQITGHITRANVAEAMKEVEEAVSEIKQGTAELEKKEQELQKDGIEIKHELEHYDSVVKENTQKIKHWKKEILPLLSFPSVSVRSSVRPPKKSWKNISNLSGGEKTLSSLALVFALHHYKPTPLYVMDEIDAALDFKNVSIVANYIKERTKNAQFIIISLRNNMFELADRLIGIYKTYNCTKSVTINPKKISMPLMTVDTNVTEATR
ncbi:hypothetical protein LSH36_727g01027 [Paralvinella palmiformis]|uniref:SMC hinge domain-containing protein n=1 Tax=Paralvinella palmiformis TaxID=53620 RepID=A0AAD9J1G2_9ANNE|nr:hypothetical protein LSH36_727g01027 [Paralvinella palmiformis]